MRHASICVNVVIGVLVVLCELHVTLVVVDAVVRLTLRLIVHVVVVFFVVAKLHRIFCIWRYTLYSRIELSKIVSDKKDDFSCLGDRRFSR